MNVEIVVHERDTMIATIIVQPTLIEEIKQRQMEDESLKKICDELATKPRPEFNFVNSVLKFQNRLCVPNIPGIKKNLMEEAHASNFSIHPGSTKMYRDLNKNFWWPTMKREIAEFVSKCLQCQQVKAEHQKPVGLMQPLPIPEWKWEHLTMDFIVGLPRTFRALPQPAKDFRKSFFPSKGLKKLLDLPVHKRRAPLLLNYILTYKSVLPDIPKKKSKSPHSATTPPVTSSSRLDQGSTSNPTKQLSTLAPYLIPLSQRKRQRRTAITSEMGRKKAIVEDLLADIPDIVNA
ncbi:uncharacterized protein LOC114290387 [Camellia sinensis]|uniref:uncharacterized protein LOC114290387 n=1 Tax=Camellia sinensis TaxID=4442 RepID=UPI001036E08A|nr:uncharacterized protein LOC114290387 [Camellia sinensis]